MMIIFLLNFFLSISFGEQNHFLNVNRDFVLVNEENIEFCPEGKFYFNKELNRFFLGARYSFSLNLESNKNEKNSLGCDENINSEHSENRLLKKTILSNCLSDKFEKKIKIESFEFDPVKRKYFFESKDFLGKKIKCIYK